ncbi:ABC transporter ATP-binding protein [Actinomadura madurae]|uniref:ABC transporter ATP-binding protein n=1 Tax=Actinomadura madurae TaxID=1993 RepID=UPI0020D1FB31|nr:ATP-binding cassette domain-containing protein [Actinomadura madurae]MCQ0012595.1 ATP-binding cassette domain-containing protein [Actinomadura madurae]
MAVRPGQRGGRPRYRGASKRDARDRARDWVARVGLAGFEGYYPHQLSGGMRKRVALAQTLVNEPSVLLMDEPFSALDVQTRGLMQDELLRLWSGSGAAVVFVTHDLEEALVLSDRVVVMTARPRDDQGRVRRAAGPPPRRRGGAADRRVPRHLPRGVGLAPRRGPDHPGERSRHAA